MTLFRPLFTVGIFLSSLAVAAPARADTITGKVVGPDGKPVPGARIFVTTNFSTGESGRQDTKNLTSDASGAFSFEIPSFLAILKPNEKNPQVARVVVTAPGFGLAQASLSLLPGDSNTICLEKGTALRGKVLDTMGKPVVGVDVRLDSVYLGGPQGESTSYL